MPRILKTFEKPDCKLRGIGKTGMILVRGHISRPAYSLAAACASCLGLVAPIGDANPAWKCVLEIDCFKAEGTSYLYSYHARLRLWQGHVS